MAPQRRIPSAGLLLGLLALGVGCALPPPNDEVPLTSALPGELESGSRADVAPPVDPADGATQRATVIAAREPDDGGNPDGLGVADDAEVFGPRPPVATAVIEVQDTPAAPLERVDDAAMDVDLHALERDGRVEPPPSVETSLVPSGVVASAAHEDQEVTAAEASSRGVAATEEPVAILLTNEPIAFEELSVETTDGLRMNYRVGGAGPIVILIHGWCGNGAQWDLHASALAVSNRVFIVDLPGHGSSGGEGRETWTIPQFASDVAQLVETEDLNDVVLVGHAMGGQVALEAVVRLPGRVRAIIGVDSLQRLGVDPNPDRVTPFIARFTNDFAGSMEAFIAEAVHPNTAPEVRERILADALDCSPEVAIALMTHFGVHDPRRAASTVDCRVICINSEMAPTDIEGNRALLTSFDVDLMASSGHWPHLELPGAFQTHLISELNRVQPPRPDEVEARLHSLSPIVYTRDVAATRDFYVDGLLFIELDRRPRDETQAPDFVSLERDGASLMIQSMATLQSDLPDVSVQPQDAVLFLRVADLEAERRRLGDDVEIAVQERTLSSGSRQLVVRDPAGTFVVLQQAPRVTAR